LFTFNTPFLMFFTSKMDFGKGCQTFFLPSRKAVRKKRSSLFQKGVTALTPVYSVAINSIV
jgi:hypothetical protein